MPPQQKRDQLPTHLGQEQASAPPEQLLFDGIANQLHAEASFVPPGQTCYEVGDPLTREVTSRDSLVKQRLYGVIRAGGGLFGVVKVSTATHEGEIVDKFVLSRFGSSREDAGPDERATIVGVLNEGDAVAVFSAPSADEQDQSSPELFKIGIAGSLLNIDTREGPVGTQLILGHKARGEQSEERVGFKIVKRLARRRHSPQHIVPANPLEENLTLWAPLSSEMRAAVLSPAVESPRNKPEAVDRINGQEVKLQNQTLELPVEDLMDREQAFSKYNLTHIHF